MRDRRDMIRLHLQNGVTDLKDIRESYNKLSDGGDVNSDANVQKRIAERQAANSREAVVNYEVDNPSIRTQVGEALQLPYRWMVNPQNIIGDVTGYGPSSQNDFRQARRNIAETGNSGNFNWAAGNLPAALYNVSEMTTGPVGAARNLMANYMADDTILEGVGTGTAAALGYAGDKYNIGKLSKGSENLKRMGAIADFRQS
jgi:hypothetical protein